MRTNTWKRWLTLSGKILILGIIAIVIWTPFSQLFSTPTALAQVTLTNFKLCVSNTEKTADGKPKPVAPVDGKCPDNSSQVSGSEGSSACNSIASCLAYVVYIFTVGLGSAVAYVGAWVLAIATRLSLSSTAYALTFLTEGWGVVRDITNMFFILILVYIAFTVMFKAETADTMKRLALVIFIALIINFSFFFTRVVIDAGNLLAVQFYNAIEGQTLGETSKKDNSNLTGSIAGASGFLGAGASTKDLTSSIMNGIGAQKILSTPSFQKFQQDNAGSVSGLFAELIALIFVYIALGAILFMLAAIFFTVGIKFIVRVAVLWLLIIVSPLAFIARTIPKGEHYYNQWQDALIKHAFYPAVFLFVFWILTLFMDELTKNGTVISSTFNDLNKVQQGGLLYVVPLVAIIVIKLGFVIALLYIGLKASDAVGVMGAGLARTATGKAWGAGFGALGWAGRNSIGWGGRSFATSTVGQRLGTQGGFLGRTLWRGSGRLGGASFDLRGAPGVKKGLALSTGVDVGVAGGKGGFAAAYDARVKRREDEAKKLKPSQQQLLKAEQAVINSMGDADKQRLKTAAEEYAKARKNQKDGIASSGEVREKREAYTTLVTDLQIKDKLEKARKAAGSENAKKYAASIESRGWGRVAVLPMWMAGADNEAATKIREIGNEADRLMHLLRDAPSGTTSQPAAPTPQPANDNRRGSPPPPANDNGPKTPPSSPSNPPPPPPPQPQMTSSTPLQKVGGQVQFGGSSGYEIPPGVKMYQTGLSEGRLEKGLASLSKTVAEQGKLTRSSIDRGARESASATREGLKISGTKLSQVVDTLKKAERKADERADIQLNELRAHQTEPTPPAPGQPPPPKEIK